MLLQRLSSAAIRKVGNGDFIRRASTSAYTVSAHGDTQSVLSLQRLDLPDSATGDEVIVRWLAAGVDPLDLAAIRGEPSAKPFISPEMPAVPGSEGVAIVDEIGPNVKSVKVGDYVIPIKSSVGTLCETGVVSESKIVSVPSTVRLELAATLSTSPFTAFRLLSDFGSLSPGDVIVQNEASGAIGSAIVQIAKAMGLKTISLVNVPAGDYAPTVERLKLMGGDVVIGEAYVESAGFQAVLDDLPKPKLGINGSSAESCGILADLVGEGGAIVTHSTGVSNGAAVQSKNLAEGSFSLPEWLEDCSREDVEKMVSALTKMIENEALTAWLQRVRFDELQVAIKAGGTTQRKLVAIMAAAGEM